MVPSLSVHFSSGVRVTECEKSPRVDAYHRESTEPLCGMVVIVVDDDNDSREIVATVLELYGAHVVTAPGAKVALHLLRQHRADAIVTDLMMPGEDGYWLLHQLRHFERLAVPIIAVSGVVTSANDVLHAGFDAFLRKPIDPDDVVRLVAETRPIPGGLA
jgi:CheY-like chemotaxis protein